MNIKKKCNFYSEELGIKAILGYYAQQTDGSVWLEKNGTVILAAVVSEASESFPGFLPLSVDYREIYSATGKIPGGYFKREGKPTDREVLISRIIDRTLRPLFVENYFDKIAITITAYSIDKKSLPIELAVMAASIALFTSGLPFMGPVGCIEVFKHNNQWLYNADHDIAMKTKNRVIVAGNYNGINMIEAVCEELHEDDLVEVLFDAHKRVQKQIEWQQAIAAEYINYPVSTSLEAILEGKVSSIFHGESLELRNKMLHWRPLVNEFLTDDRVQNLMVADKVVRNVARRCREKEFLALHKDAIAEMGIDTSVVIYVFDTVLKEKFIALISRTKKRVDGRGFDDIREISCEVGVLPCSHGSGIFTRGRTQLLVSTTLGGQDDLLKVDTVLDEQSNNLMLHYNFLPFSVGEARPLKSPGRREIGHGFLAQNAFKAVLPTLDVFPYAIRIVSDVIECDGSSSMGTVCGSSLSLFNAGVPLKSHVAGIAMGMITLDDIITDINGMEDELGWMDLKVAGTIHGVTALQMDIKYKDGLQKELFVIGFEKAKKARHAILEVMNKTISSPNQLSPLIPVCRVITIPKEKIGSVIGSGGKVIKEITEKTNTQITIEDGGKVNIFGISGQGIEQAIFWINTIVGNIEIGAISQGIIKKIVEFGIFVEIAPYCDGLVHISSFNKQEQQQLQTLYKEGTVVKIKIDDYDKSSNRIRLKIINN
jgi:polyribonucleotide nucleotidyltransferase